MSITRGLVVVTVAFVALLGCKSEPTDAASAVSSSSPGAMRVEAIQDPSLNMNAFQVNVPEKWHFQSVLEQGGKCVPTPFAVFRATSPDGLSFMERMPTMGWAWGTGFQATVKHEDCLPMKGPMSAQDYLKYLAATMKVEYVADEPVPEEENAKAQQSLADMEAIYAPKYAAMHLEPPRNTRQLARATVRFQNGSFAMKGHLWAEVDCREAQMKAAMASLSGVSDVCAATVRYLAAPENSYPAMMRMWDHEDEGGRGLQAWQQAWSARNQQQANAWMARNREETQAAMQASAQRFQHDMAVQQHMHEEFMATMQRGTDMSMARTQENMNARSTATSDWVDYSLDRQTVLDPVTGQVSKVSSTYSHTWIDSTGKVSYQTNDANANPNGVLQGTWTQQQKVHGDGSY